MSQRVDWSKEEDQFILNAVQNAKAANKSITKALKEVVKNLPGRTEAGCHSRYYQYLRPNESNVDLYVGKRTGNPNFGKQWSPLEDTILSSAVLGSLASGKSVEYGIKIAMSQLPSRTKYAIKFRWYQVLALKHQDKIEAAKQQQQTVIQTAVASQVSLAKNDAKVDIEKAVEYLEIILKSVKNKTDREKELEEKLEAAQRENKKLVQSYNELLLKFNQITELFQTSQELLSK